MGDRPANVCDLVVDLLTHVVPPSLDTWYAVAPVTAYQPTVIESVVAALQAKFAEGTSPVVEQLTPAKLCARPSLTASTLTQ